MFWNNEVGTMLDNVKVKLGDFWLGPKSERKGETK